MNPLKKYASSLKRIEQLENLVNIQANGVFKFGMSSYPPIYRTYYTGEKTPGEMGAAKDYTAEYSYLRVRSWQAYTESDIAQLIINKYVKWVIGNGLKLQSEPNEIVLSQENISFDLSQFTLNVEPRFNLYTASIYSDYKKMQSINKLSSEAYKNAVIGGDVLCVLRIIDGHTVVQLIDGACVCSPFLDSNLSNEALIRGNKIINGVEVDSKGEHVAYYIQNPGGKYSRITRYGETSGCLQAFLIYGCTYRIDNVRGMPLLSAVLETIKKIDRYKEATVGSAEERQKIPYFFEHGVNSTGENPLLAGVRQAAIMGTGEAPESKTVDEYEAAATKIAITTQKSVFNLPNDVTVKSPDSKNELSFKDFYNTNAQYLCATVGIPFEVALSMFNSNYSASRAAIKDWEYNIKTSRADFSNQYYQPIYNMWLEMQILSGKIQAPGYAKAMIEKNIYALEAFRNARFLGANVPHIDPVKEVQAERLKLADDITPLTTLDQATEALGCGDFRQVIKKVKEEQQYITDMPVRLKEKAIQQETDNNNNNE